MRQQTPEISGAYLRLTMWVVFLLLLPLLFSVKPTFAVDPLSKKVLHYTHRAIVLSIPLFRGAARPPLGCAYQ
jgi:hypothetical protein